MKTCAALVATIALNSVCSAVSIAPPFVDYNYGVNGITHFSYDLSSSNNYDQTTAATLLPDGSLILGGYAYIASDVASSPFLAAKISPTGILDPNFGSGGVALLPIGSLGGVNDFAALTDGRIAYLGIYPNGPNLYITIGRLNSNGSPDMTFNFSGSRGIGPSNFGASYDQLVATRVLALSDGRLLGLGYATNSSGTTSCAALFRMTTGGSFDSTFAGGNGYACYNTNGTTSHTFLPFDMELQGDGKVVIVGGGNQGNSDNSDMVVLRLLSDGSADTDFGTDGLAFAAFDLGGTLFDMATAVSIDSTGRIVIVGTATTSTGQDVVAARFLSNGQVDTTFGTGGRLDIVTSDTFKPSVACLPDGRILITASSDPFSSFEARMLKVDGSPDTSFGISGVFGFNAGSYGLGGVYRMLTQGDYIYFPGDAQSTAVATDVEFGAVRVILPIFASGFEEVSN
jgi:uncharacterized delta-60 repeat protein